MMHRGRLGAAAVALLVGAGVVLPAAPAAAVLYPIGLSSDGTSFAPSYPGSLFSGATIVPGGAVTRTFWVKNNETSAGNLAVAIRNVGSLDTLFVSSLSATAVAGATSGRAAFADAEPCVSLVKGVRLASSGITRVDVTLELASSLTGREAQQSLALFDLFVTLTSTDVAAPDGCTPPVPPPAGAETSDDGYAATATVPGARQGGGSATPAPSPAPEELPHSGDDPVHARYGNTDRFYQEYFVAWWLLAFVLGGVYAWLRERRRERIPE
ncbi:MAG: hypothetical protein J0H23_11075 [Micrococcales bacterium]|nr:hypothetical protein [Micrococcales bacterium]OJX69492.1 MAG: hypothetical protein BGO94_13345 [Micrococcales bacterium 72-143]